MGADRNRVKSCAGSILAALIKTSCDLFDTTFGNPVVSFQSPRDLHAIVGLATILMAAVVEIHPKLTLK